MPETEIYDIMVKLPQFLKKKKILISRSRSRIWKFQSCYDILFYLQGDSIAQWWQWQPPKGSNHGSTTTLKANVVRTNSLKETGHTFQDEDEDDEVFVTADPVRG